MNTFLPYSDFIRSAKCLDYKRLGKQRVEAWQIYQTLKQGKYKKCSQCLGEGDEIGYVYSFRDIIGNNIIKCQICKGTGKIKTAWYNHPITQMWKGYEQALLRYGMAICEEWKRRGYKDIMLDKFVSIYNIEEDKYIENKK